MNNNFNYEEFIKWEIEMESVQDYAKLYELIPEKNIKIFTCNIELNDKHLCTNILFFVKDKFICTKTADFKLLVSELELFYNDITSKFIENKSLKTPDGIVNSIKVKGTNIYLSKAETKLIAKESNNILRRTVFAVNEDMKVCEESEYWQDLLKRSNLY